MKLKYTRRTSWLCLLAVGSIMFQGCSAVDIVAGQVLACYGEDTLSADEYDSLNFIDRLLYEKNDCGRYEPVSGTLSDWF